MNREILTSDQCSALAARLGLPDLCAHANALHSSTCAAGAWAPMTIVRSFVISRPFHENGGGFAYVFFAFAGTRSEETEGYEGLEVTFASHEYQEACAALAEHSTVYDEQFIADDLAERIRAGVG